MKEIWHILIVDDDEVDRMAVRRLLKASDLSLNFTEAADYVSAITVYEKQSFDCILIDYRLPGKDGLTLVQDLRQLGVKIPLIVLTGQGDEQIAVELMKAGASDYLSKSRLSTESLAHLLRNSLRIYQAEKAAEEARQQREEMVLQREDLLSRLTHDLRTPLVAADRMLNLFEKGAFGQPSPEMNEAITVMIRSNRNLLQMVNTMLEVYRHEAGFKIISYSNCNIAENIQEVIEELKPLALEKEINLSMEIGEDVNTNIQGDCLELRRLFTNLVSNAIKFTDQGFVEIRFRSDNTNLVIEVEDTGIGINKDDQASLFERFRQGKNKRAGSGLGLYLSRLIVEAHQGKLQVKSELEKGTIFTVYLPQLDRG